MHNAPSATAPMNGAPPGPGVSEATFTPEQAQREANQRVWGSGGLLRRYGGRRLRPAERVLFDTHVDALSGTVLELGCGGGRLTAHLIERATSVTGVDLAADMIAYCRRTYPQAAFRQGDLRELSDFETGGWEAIVAGYAVIDVLTHDERGAFLDELHRLLRPSGLLIFSSHNLACAPLLRGPIRSINATNPVSFASQVLRLPRSIRNRRRLLAWEQVGSDHAILNDAAHDFSLLHYYITRDEQERQLAAHGFELHECLRLDGEPVGPGESASGWHELHYAATRVELPGAGA
jgi:SAM-dependent methyltransferase